ncbi:MAG: ABC-type transport auxiliary lipoprotein family protein [Alkalispirochaetaceae bacterium]
MKTSFGIIGILFLTLLLLGGCVFFQSSETFYYLFEYPEPPVLRPEAPQVMGTVAVEELEVSPVFDRRQIVRRTSGPQLSFLSNELWAVTPSTGIQSLMIERVRDSGLFESVEPERRDLDPRYLIGGRLESLAYDCCEENQVAKVSLTLLFRDAVSGELLARSGGDFERELPEGNTYRFVIAVNETLGEQIDALIEEIDRWSRE